MPHSLYRGRAEATVGELTAQERAALVTYDIMRGARMTTSEIAHRMGTTKMGAWHMMQRVSRVVPIYLEEGNGYHDESTWRVLD